MGKRRLHSVRSVMPGDRGEIAGRVEGRLGRNRRGLEVLLELHEPAEVKSIYNAVDMIGINNRDLRNFVTNLEASKRLAASLPADAVKIAESGISSPADISQLRRAGFNGFLIGEAFMSTPQPSVTLKKFIDESQL